MAFTTFGFLWFLLIVMCIFYALPQKYRKYWILLTSYFFYSSADVKLLLVLLTITLISYVGGWCIHNSENKKRFLFVIFFGADILILVVFKYVPFLLNCVNRMTAVFNSSISFSVPEIIVPIGLSFIIFQSSTYLGDVYKQKIEPVAFAKCALLIAYFPTLLCGPIQKSRDLIPQLEFEHKFDIREFRAGLLLMAYGLWVKFFIADALAKMINPIFDNYTKYYGVYYLFAAIGFSIQIYADFSAYSDIARGISKIIGIKVVKNFNAPYLSRNLFTFWKNWHMSLNAWFVEYIYIPLGGSRKGKIRKYFNTMAVFLLSGLWHGASWSFVAWGGINGLLQVIGEATMEVREKIRKRMGFDSESIFLRWFQRSCVFGIITITWIFFRMQSFSAACHVVVELFKFNFIRILDPNMYNEFGTTASILIMVVLVMIFACMQTMRKEEGKLYKAYLSEPELVQIIIITVLFVFLTVGYCRTVAQTNTSFIYFQF